MNRSQPDETSKGEGPARKKQGGEKNIDWPTEVSGPVIGMQEACLLVWPSVLTETFNQSFILFSHPAPNLIPGAAKSEAFSVPKGQNVPLLSCFRHQCCSGRPVPLLCSINYPFSTASQWPEAFGNLSFTDGLSLFLFVIGFSIVSAPGFHFNGLFEEGEGNYIWIVFQF